MNEQIDEILKGMNINFTLPSDMTVTISPEIYKERRKAKVEIQKLILEARIEELSFLQEEDIIIRTFVDGSKNIIDGDDIIAYPVKSRLADLKNELKELENE